MFKMMTLAELGEPEIVALPALEIAGVTAEYTMERTQEIPQQWAEFVSELEAVDTTARETYGIIRGDRGRPMQYTCGIAAGSLERTPESWTKVEVPARTYAVFRGSGGVELIRQMWPAIWQVWFPSVGKVPAEGPMVEFYADRFTAAGGPFEIRIPMDEPAS